MLVTPPLVDLHNCAVDAPERLARSAAVKEAVMAGLPTAARLGARLAFPLTDQISLNWLRRVDDPYLAEIRRLAAGLGGRGTLTLTLSYEWGCTSGVFDAGAGPPRLFHTLDWPFQGLGRLIEVQNRLGRKGNWIAAGWPGVTGVLQGVAPGRFAACINQAPERTSGFGRPIDWAASKRRFLKTSGWPPAHLLRHVFETAPDYATGVERLRDEPLSTPAIFIIAGCKPGEGCVIERLEDAADVRDMRHGVVTAANHFAASGAGRWRARGHDSQDRMACLAGLGEPPQIDMLKPPLLNPLTRLAMAGSAAGDISVCGYEAERPATLVRHVLAKVAQL